MFKVFSLVFFAALNTFAAGDMPSLQAGNYAAAGSADFSFSKDQTSQFYMNPSLEYFVTDHLSLGGSAFADIYSDHQFYGIGPSATLYFWQSEKWAAYVGASAGYNFSTKDKFNYWNVVGKIGVEYFFTPSVALGPVYMINHQIGNNYVNDYDFNNILVQFSLYL